MKKLIIVGAGGLGREVWELFCKDNSISTDCTFKGFLDDRGNPPFVDPKAILGRPDFYEPKPGDVFVCAIGAPKVRQQLIARLSKRGAQFTTLIHPTAIVAASAEIGQGCVIKPYTLISSHAQIGDFCVIQPHCTVEHDVRIGAYCLIGAGSVLQGEASVADGSTVQPLQRLECKTYYNA